LAGSLIKIDEEIVTSAVASVTLTGIDSTYDVYMVKYNDLEFSSDSQVYARVTESGTENTTSNYDVAQKYLKADSAFGNSSGTNRTFWDLSATNESTVTGHSGLFYLFNFNNASEYSFITIESIFFHHTGNSVRGYAGGGVFTSTSSCDGIFIYPQTGNFNAGVFTLYGLKK